MLQATEDLKKLDAVETGNPGTSNINGVVQRAQDYIWFRIDALESLAGTQTADWHFHFDKMIAYAKSKGWVDEEMMAVRIHISS